MEPVSSEVERYVRELFDKFPCHKREGMKLEKVGVGEIVVSVTVFSDQTTCYKNSMQGGYMGVFTDSSMWMSLMTNPDLWGLVVLTEEWNVMHFKRVKSGETLKISTRHIKTHLDKKGRTHYLSAAEVRNSKGELVAMARAANVLVKKNARAKK